MHVWVWLSLHSLEQFLGEDILGEILIATEDVHLCTWGQPEVEGVLR